MGRALSRRSGRGVVQTRCSATTGSRATDAGVRCGDRSSRPWQTPRSQRQMLQAPRISDRPPVGQVQRSHARDRRSRLRDTSFANWCSKFTAPKPLLQGLGISCGRCPEGPRRPTASAWPSSQHEARVRSAGPSVASVHVRAPRGGEPPDDAFAVEVPVLDKARPRRQQDMATCCATTQPTGPIAATRRNRSGFLRSAAPLKRNPEVSNKGGSVGQPRSPVSRPPDRHPSPRGRHSPASRRLFPSRIQRPVHAWPGIVRRSLRTPGDR